MFPEYSEHIELLRSSDRNFSRLCDKHASLDQEIDALIARKSNDLQVQIESLKKKKLAIKEQVYAILQREAPHLELKQHKNYMDQQWRSTQVGGSRASAA